MLPKTDFVIDRTQTGKTVYLIDFRWAVVVFCFSGIGGIILGSLIGKF